MDTRNNNNNFPINRNNKNLSMNKNELLSWLGNVINFLIILYLIRTTFGTLFFDTKNAILSASALLISTLINLYTSLNKIK